MWLKFDILLRKQVNSEAGNPREANMGLGGGVSVIIKIVLLERFFFFPFIWILAAANLKASHFSEKALCTGGGIVWGLINTKLFQKNLFKHLITCKEMLTCLTPLNYIVTGSFSAYPKPDCNTFSDRLVRCSLSESRYVINWAGALFSKRIQVCDKLGRVPFKNQKNHHVRIFVSSTQIPVWLLDSDQMALLWDSNPQKMIVVRLLP